MDKILTSTLQTPCFLLDEEELGRGISGFYRSLKRRFAHCVVGYSVKTNSLPYAIAKAKDFGCFAEVVSDDELDLALECGYKMNEIVFNGPMKSKVRFLDALKGGATVNIETHRELEWLKELPSDGFYKIGIRLGVNISDVSLEDADGENDFSRFGFNDVTDEFAYAIESIRSIPQVKLVGLHIHRTCHSRSVRFYKRSVAYAASVIKKYHLDLDYLDIGGGYYGIFPNAPTFDDYVTAIYESLQKQSLEKLAIIVEPGNALTASAFTYYSRVIDVKQLSDCRILTTDGTRNDIDPFFHKNGYMTEINRANESGQVVPLQIVAGATCLEYDQLFRLENQPEIKVGDVIEYKNVGAYTLSLTPMFINYFPRVYSLSSDGLKLVRDKWTAKEYIQKSNI